MTFFVGSRYEQVGELETSLPDGTVVRYKRTRLVPPTTAARGHTVRADDRLDLLAYEYYTDAERFWLVCDANDVLWSPDLLAEPGKQIGIPESEG
jgi:hypothetical protein